MARSIKQISIVKRKARNGRLFILPFTIGFLFFFLQPLIISLYFTFNKITVGLSGLDKEWVGMTNYIFAFTGDPEFIVNLMATLKNMAIQTPVIILFSIFTATIINQKFRGRTFARAIFFLPVIVTSGIIMSILKDDVFNKTIAMGAAQTSNIFQSTGLRNILYSFKLPGGFIDAFSQVVNSIFDMLWKSGVQILLFLAALQSIPGQLYEAAKIEGATAWEIFWKITFPMISAIMIVNLVYTIIDSFTDYNNSLMLLINQVAFNQGKYAYSSTLSWIFFIFVFLIIGIVNLIISKVVFYYND